MIKKKKKVSLNLRIFLSTLVNINKNRNYNRRQQFSNRINVFLFFYSKIFVYFSTKNVFLLIYSKVDELKRLIREENILQDNISDFHLVKFLELFKHLILGL